MENQKNNGTMKRSTVVIIGIIVFLLLSVATGGGVYLWRESVNKGTQNNLNEEVINLESIIEESNINEQSTDDSNAGMNYDTFINDSSSFNYDGWKTYESSEYKFSFKYNSIDPVNEYRYGGVDLLILSTLYGENELTWFVEKANNQTYQDFVDNYTLDVIPEPDITKDYTVGSVTGTLAEFEGYIGQLDADMAHIEFFLEGEGDYYFRIRLYGKGQSITDSEKDLFIKILGSIKK